MSQIFEEWLKENRKRDENVIKGEKRLEETRQQIKERIVSHFDSTQDQIWCKCDLCTLIRMKADDEPSSDLFRLLALVGLQYLLGENFNGAAAMYYYGYIKEARDNES